MSNAAITTRQTDNGGILTIKVDTLTLEFSRETDKRVFGAEDGKLWANTEGYAEELAGEIRAWGVSEARALGCAVVFWG